MKKFKIPGAIVVPEVKFEKKSGFTHGAYLTITATAIGRPDLRTVSYVAADNDYFEIKNGGGGFGSTTIPTGTGSGLKIPGLNISQTH